MSSSSLFRIAGLAGVLCGLILVFNAARRGGLIPENLFTHGVAPLSPILGLFALTGLYLWQRRESGSLGVVGYGLNIVGLAGIVGIESILNYVFPYLDGATISTLLNGPTRTMFFVISMLFLAGVLTFGLASWRARRLPPTALLLYAIGSIPIALRGVVPEITVPTGQVLAAAGVVWLSLALYRVASSESRVVSGETGLAPA
jgi:hypothetical protein